MDFSLLSSAVNLLLVSKLFLASPKTVPGSPSYLQTLLEAWDRIYFKIKMGSLLCFILFYNLDVIWIFTSIPTYRLYNIQRSVQRPLMNFMDKCGYFMYKT